MAKELTHILIARDVVKQMKSSGQQQLAGIIERNLSAYYLGAIIPDALFYDVPPFRLNIQKYIWLSRAFHAKEKAKNDQNALSLFRSIAANPRAWQLKMAFAAGIITHTVVDRIFHELIEYYTTIWGEKDAVALATHREIETLIDMMFLRMLNMGPRQIHLGQFIQLDERTKYALFRFLLAHLTEAHNPPDPSLLNALKRAHLQQHLFLRLFATRPLYHMMNLSNKLMAGRLRAWHNLFYPDDLGPYSFPVLGKLKSNSRRNKSFYYNEGLRGYKRAASKEAIWHINVALKTFPLSK